MADFEKLAIAVIGAGRLGTAIAGSLDSKKSSNFYISAVSSRSGDSLERAKSVIKNPGGRVLFTTDNIAAASRSNCIMISTPDDRIEKVCVEIVAGLKKECAGSIFIHFSGSKSLAVLRPARKAGALTASVHPLKSFASINESIRTMPGTIFGITAAGSKEREIVNIIVNRLGGAGIEVGDKKKPLYHAATCVASNYLVTLVSYAASIHRKIGIDPGDSLKGLGNLVDGTVKNIKKIGPCGALTGPIARGDTGTIKEHMYNFKKYFNEEDIEVYRVMGKATADLSCLSGLISTKKRCEIIKILEKS